MKSFLLLFILSVFLLAGCKKDDVGKSSGKTDSTKTDSTDDLAIKVTVSSKFLTNGDQWVVLYDTANNLLGYQALRSGQTLTFPLKKALPKNGLTRVFIFVYPSEIDVSIASGLTAGDFFIGKNPIPSEQTHDKLEIECDIDSITAICLDNHYGAYWDTSIGETGGDARANISNDDFIFSIARNFGPPRYKKYSAVSEDTHFTVAYNDLKLFDQNVTFNFPEARSPYLYIQGFHAGENPSSIWGTKIFSESNSRPYSTTKVIGGYLSEFSTFQTFLQVNRTGGQLYYLEYGGVPTGNITWPDPADFHLKDKTVDGFDFEANVPYQFRFTSWENGQVYWQWQARAGRWKVPVFPDVLLDKYPTLANRNIEYLGTTFIVEGDYFAEKQTSADDLTKPYRQVGVTLF